MTQKITAELIDRQNLTPREGEVAALLCEGLCDKAIARQLSISLKTLSAHRVHVYDKLQVRRQAVNSRCAAIAVLVARGMVKISAHSICLLLIVNLFGLDNSSVLRAGRSGAARPTAARVRAWES